MALITYTPHYRELDYTRKIETEYVYLKYQTVLKIMFKSGPTVSFGLDMDAQDRNSFKDDFSIVFAAVITKVPFQSSYIGPEPKELIMLDNRGNKYHIQAIVPPGMYVPDIGVPRNTSMYFTYFYAKPGPQTPILPDSMIDHLIDNELKLLGDTYMHPVVSFGRVSNQSYELLPSKPGQTAIPHRKFEPSAELAAYLASLERVPNSVNYGTQTNTVAHANMGQQANLNFEQQFSNLKNKYNKSKTRKNRNQIQQKMKNMVNRLREL